MSQRSLAVLLASSLECECARLALRKTGLLGEALGGMREFCGIEPFGGCQQLQKNSSIRCSQWGNCIGGQPRQADCNEDNAGTPRYLIQSQTSCSYILLLLSPHSNSTRKSIARVLTVMNQKQRTNLRELYKGKKYLPLDLRPKQTRAIRRRLTKVSIRNEMEREGRLASIGDWDSCSCGRGVRRDPLGHCRREAG